MRVRNIFVAILLLIGASFACSLSAPQEDAPIIAPLPPATVMPVIPATVLPPTIAMEKEISAILDTANSGSVCPKGPIPLDNGGPPALIGEFNDDYECEGFLTFDIQGVPSSAKILSALFTPGSCTVISGNPFTTGVLSIVMADIGNFDVSDFGSVADRGHFQDGKPNLSFQNCSLGVIEITNMVNAEVKRGSKVIQFRIDTHPGNFMNGIDDTVSFSGTTPTLVIKYK